MHAHIRKWRHSVWFERYSLDFDMRLARLTIISFFGYAPEVFELLQAWVRGYRRIGILSQEEVNREIATFVMLGRLLHCHMDRVAFGN